MSQQSAQQAFIHVNRRTDGSSDLSIHDLTLRRPDDNSTLIEHVNLTLKPGDRILISGASGSGKSTLIRAIREAWDAGEGRIEIPANARIITSSQKAYMPPTSLKGIVSYPSPEESFYDSQIEASLRAVGHDRLVQFLPERQTEHLINLTLDQIPHLLQGIDKSKAQETRIQELAYALVDLVPTIVQKNIDTAQPLSYQNERHLRQKLIDILDKELGHSTPRLQIELIASKISDALNQNLVKRMLDQITADIPVLLEKNLGKLRLASTDTLNYFSTKVSNLLAKNMEAAFIKAKVNPLNQKQREFIALTIKQKIDETLDPHHTWNFTVNKMGTKIEGIGKIFEWASTKTTRYNRPFSYATGYIGQGFAKVAAPFLKRDWYSAAFPGAYFFDKTRNALSADTDRIMHALRLPFLKKAARRTSEFLMATSTLYLAREVVNGDVLMRRLSGGEQQRLAFARAILHHPDILILDEVTAALDKEAAQKLYEDIVSKLPETIIISVAHNMHILEHHTLHGHVQDQQLRITPVVPENMSPGLTSPD